MYLEALEILKHFEILSYSAVGMSWSSWKHSLETEFIASMVLYPSQKKHLNP